MNSITTLTMMSQARIRKQSYPPSLVFLSLVAHLLIALGRTPLASALYNSIAIITEEPDTPYKVFPRFSFLEYRLWDHRYIYLSNYQIHCSSPLVPRLIFKLTADDLCRLTVLVRIGRFQR